MKLFIIVVILCFSCGDNSAPSEPDALTPDAHIYTWGDTMQSVSVVACTTLKTCLFINDVNACVAEKKAALCVAYPGCDLPVDQITAEADIAACSSALNSLTPDSDGCYYLGTYGILPEACWAFSDLAPH